MSKTGYIYKLVSNDIEIKDCYVGSTQNFRTRKCDHRKVCNSINYKQHNFYVYQFIRNNNGFDNWSMIQLEEYKFNIRNELNARERHWIEQLGATLNKCIPTRTRQEWRKEYKEINIDKLKEQGKQYRNQNKDKLKAQKKQYKDLNKDKIREQGKEYKEKNKDKIKQYRELNKDRIKDNIKQYYENHKTQIKEQRSQRTVCECGAEIFKQNMSIHKKSKKHKQWESLYNYIYS